MFPKKLSLLLISVLCITADISADEQTKSFLEILFNSNNNIETAASEAELLKAAVQLPDEEIAKTAVARETFVFEIVGEGWMLESYTDASGEVTENLRYSGRDYIAGNTVFSFYPYAAGEYIIYIRKTDYTAASVERRLIRLSVIEGFEANNNGEDKVESQPDPAAEAVVIQETAETQVSTHVLHAETETDLAAEPDIVTEVVEDINAAEEAAYVFSSSAEAIEAAERLSEAGGCAAAAGILEDYIESHSGDELDKPLLILAGYYEDCAEIRDERRAVEFYRQIVDYYPISIYYNDARERIRYLERQYIYIR